MNSRGLDLLSSRAWSADAVDGANATAKIVSEGLPSALLPLSSREPLIVGQRAEGHRRGRGLPFPAEAQVPVLGVSENEAGRVLLAAAFERIAKAEREWGQLADTKLGWRPDGQQAVQVDAASIIARTVEHEANPGDTLGLVVPDSLGVAGQQAILSAIRDRSVILVPRSVAASLAWCCSDPFGLREAGPTEKFVGYVEVVDLSLGRWSLTKLPIYRLAAPTGPRLVPAHFPSFKRTALRPSGLGVLTRQADAEYHDFLKVAFPAPWLMGGRSFHTIQGKGFRARRADFPSLSDLEGEGLLEGLEALKTAGLAIETPRDWGQCLGVLVSGALASAKSDDRPLAFRVAQYLARPVLPSPEGAAALGAAVAAAGLGTDLPTWLEMVDQLDLYYNNRNVRGDLESAWKPVLVPRLVKAGLEYRNPEPIAGLKLQAGRNTVQITIRRPAEDGRMTYRRVTSTPGRTNESDIPLEIDVVAHPGQGFAVVKIHSKETGVFDSRLDWQKMEPCEEPKPPPLGYIPVAAEIRADAELWRRAQADLAGLALALEGNRPPEDVEFLARDANRKIGLLTAIRTDPFATASASSDSLRYLIRALDRNGQPPTKAGEALMARLRLAGVRWLVTHRRHSGGAKWLVRHFGWWHLGCPDGLRTETVTRLTITPALCSAIDLHLAGLVLQTPGHLSVFFRAYLEVMPKCGSPNAWLRAFRNLIKFNEHALQGVSPLVAERLYAATLARLIWAFENGRPQIAQNCVEALLYCLKRRRYEDTFVSPDSALYRRTTELLGAWDSSAFRFRAKLNEMRLTFSRFLRTEGSLQDLATLMAEDDEEAED